MAIMEGKLELELGLIRLGLGFTVRRLQVRLGVLFVAFILLLFICLLIIFIYLLFCLQKK